MSCSEYIAIVTKKSLGKQARVDEQAPSYLTQKNLKRNEGQDAREYRRDYMKKKYDLMWLLIMVAYIISIALLGWIAVSTILAMAQNGNQAWNFWNILSGVTA